MNLPVINQLSGCEDTDICTECGGECCKSYAGYAAPDDFGSRETLVEVLVEYLSTRKWCVDCWDADENSGRIWFIRPAHVGMEGVLVDKSWGGVCSLWSKQHGCSLIFRNRPKGCRSFIPDADRSKCHYPDDGNGKKDIALEWIPYQEEIEQAMDIMRSR